MRERSWDTLTALFKALGGDGGIAPAGLGELDTAARLLGEALAALPPPKNLRGTQADELRTVALAAAEALLGRCAHPPLAEIERRALDRAAGLLARRRSPPSRAGVRGAGGRRTSGRRLGRDGRSHRMEAAHERDARRAANHRAAGDLLHRFEALLTGGERLRALSLVAAVSGLEATASLRLRATAIERRLCHGGAVSLRAPGGASVRVAPLPTELGRDRERNSPARSVGLPPACPPSGGG